MSHFSLPTLLLLLFCGFSLVLLDPIFSTKPRIRREWRTLDSQTKQNVANAFWIMRTTSTDAGQKMYGPHYFALDELIMLHACAVEDIRCDQGHVGPHFMTFHRLFLLKFELSLLAIDPSVEALLIGTWLTIQRQANTGMILKCTSSPKIILVLPRKCERKQRGSQTVSSPISRLVCIQLKNLGLILP